VTSFWAFSLTAVCVSMVASYAAIESSRAYFLVASVSLAMLLIADCLLFSAMAISFSAVVTFALASVKAFLATLAYSLSNCAFLLSAS
jgi:hypothetical protein